MQYSLVMATMKTEEQLAADCVAEIRRQMETQGINASGRTSRSLGYEAKYGEITIFAEGEHAPITTLQEGSGPHYNSQPEGFYAAIREWVEIRFPNEERKDNLANAIANKIRKEGTRLWRETQQSGIPRDVYYPALKQLADDFALLMGQSVYDTIMQSIDDRL